MTEKTHTIRVTLERLQGKGLPKLMVKLANDRILPTSAIPQSYDRKVELTGGTNSVYIDMTMEQRYEANPDCDFAGYWSDGGNELCTVYIAVECQELEDMCAYKVRMQLFENAANGSSGKAVTARPARYVPLDQDYVDVTVPYGSTARFYYPVVPEESGDLLIFVNKTSPVGHEGDAKLLLNVQKNSENSYLSWIYPSSTRYTIASETNDPIQPEMIDICKEKLIEACGGADASSTTLEDAANGVTNDCSLLISLYSKIEDEDVNLRLRVFNSTNKLYPEKPVHGTH